MRFNFCSINYLTFPICFVIKLNEIILYNTEYFAIIKENTDKYIDASDEIVIEIPTYNIKRELIFVGDCWYILKL